ncbi:hypothetical protein KKF61_07975 [Patescibacteria group bacterium]|nr:hypothetical protein [Patescibacteria group bacterium]
MKYLFLIGIFIVGSVFAAPPVRQHNYVSQTPIDPAAVTANEDVIFSYLQGGVDTIAANAVGASAIATGAVGASELASTTVTAGAYTNTNLTVDVDGRITTAASGAAAGAPTYIEDADSDTKVQAEESADEDIIRFDIGGTETIVFGDGTTEEMVLITNSGTSDGMKISQDGDLAANQYGLWVYSNADQDTSELVFIEQDNASSTKAALVIQQDGSASSILASEGSAANPAYSFINETNSGMYLIISQELAFSIAGNIIHRTLSTGLMPQGAKVMDQGNGSTSLWDDCYADDWHNVADIAFLDNRKDTKTGEEFEVDDLAIIKNIKPKKIDDKIVYNDKGFAYWDDDSLPQWVFSTDDDGEIILVEGTDKRSISTSTLSGLALGAIKQLVERVETLEAKVAVLEGN